MTREMRYSPGDLKQFQALSLPDKITHAERRIRAWLNHWQGQAYVAFSGGKDSTVLLHLVRSIDPTVPAVFFDTGMEFPEIRKFALEQLNVIRIKPKMTFRKVIEKHGYPVVSKRVAQYVSEYQSGLIRHPDEENATMRLRRTGVKGDGSFSRLGKVSDKWQFLFNAPFRVSHRCCLSLKHDPANKYEDESGRKPMIGTMAGESQQRSLQWQMDGCNAFSAARPTAKPLSIWTEADVWAYLHGGNREGRPIPYSTIYDLGYPRTGCVFCMFGVHLEQRNTGTNRFLRLEQTHPALHDYCTKPREVGGLGLGKVLDFIGVPWRKSQILPPWGDDSSNLQFEDWIDLVHP